MAYNSFTGSGIAGSSSQFNTDEVNMLSNSLANSSLNTSQVNAEGRRIYARVSSISQMNTSGRQTQSQISSTYQTNTGGNQMESQFLPPSQVNTSGRQMQSQFYTPSNMNSSGMSMPSRNPSTNQSNTGGNLMQSQFSSPLRINTSGRQMKSQFSPPSNMNSIQMHMQPQIPSPYQTNTGGNQMQSQFSSFSQMNTSGRQMQSQLPYPSDMNSRGMPMPFQVSSPYPKSGNQMHSDFSSSSQIDTKGMQMQSKFSPNSQMSTGEIHFKIQPPYSPSQINTGGIQRQSQFSSPYQMHTEYDQIPSHHQANFSTSTFNRNEINSGRTRVPLKFSDSALMKTGGSEPSQNVVSWILEDGDSDEDSEEYWSEEEDSDEDSDNATGRVAKGRGKKDRKSDELPEKSLKQLKSHSDGKGWVLIIVNYEFTDSRDDLPRGTENKKLKKLFTEFNYEVRSFENLNKKKILRLIRRYASKEHSKRFVCFISSHGDVSSVLCKNGASVDIAEMYECADQKNLKGRPKCFFFDTCRSKDSKRRAEIPTIPSDNFFVGLSCLAGKRSYCYKDRKYKNMYLGYIYEIFNESFRFDPRGDKCRDIEYLIKKVNREVQEQTKQKPMYESSLNKILFLQGEGKR